MSWIIQLFSCSLYPLPKAKGPASPSVSWSLHCNFQYYTIWFFVCQALNFSFTILYPTLKTQTHFPLNLWVRISSSAPRKNAPWKVRLRVSYIKKRKEFSILHAFFIKFYRLLGSSPFVRATQKAHPQGVRLRVSNLKFWYHIIMGANFSVMGAFL